MTQSTTQKPTARSPAPALRFLAMLAAVALLMIGGWAVWRWATYPNVPDPATVDAEAVANVITSDDFTRLTPGDQRRFAMAYVDKYEELSLAELVQRAVTPDPQRRAVLEQLAQVGLKDETLAAAHGMVLDKYWSLPPEQREAFLTMLVLADTAGIAQGGQRDNADQVRRQMAEVMAHQSPETQGKLGQFLVDLEQRRQALGMGPLFSAK